MRLTALRLRDFRGYGQVMLSLPEGVTVLVGENGAGKTNLLEAVHLCCLGRSHRTSADKEMIRRGQETAAVQLIVERKDGRHEVGVRLYENARRRKVVYVNGKTASRLGELMGHATCVIFSPEDLALVKEGPQARRRFLDMLLSQEQKAYFYALQTYMTALKQRNALLKQGDVRSLSAWDEQLAAAAAPVVRLRRAACDQLHKQAAVHYRYIGGREEEIFALHYQGVLAESEQVEKDMLNGLQASREEDLRRQTTCFGPHRDDLILNLCGEPIKSFGSQGQMRTAALSMKLAAFDLLEAHQGEPPLLLLDDVLSELDPDRRRRLIARIGRAQALLTCTDQSDFIGARPSCVLRVENGNIRECGSDEGIINADKEDTL
ncbi:MAG: DNA replication/repair protein RecF [Clostridia bacterium]|nr:DNA replication/repair protein RecF [Clostridia bacterium]